MITVVFKDSGMEWQIDDDAWSGHAAYWVKSIVREVKTFRYVWRGCCDDCSLVKFYRDGVYFAMFCVTDFTASWVLHRWERAEIRNVTWTRDGKAKELFTRIGKRSRLMEVME